MQRRTFFLFVAPSVTLMALFIALPLAFVAVQSFQATQRVYQEEVAEHCVPGFPAPVCTTERRSVPVIGPDGQPETRTSWVGWDNYLALLQPGAVADALRRGVPGDILAVDFYRALRFTLVFTFVTLPLVLGLGLLLAFALNNTLRAMRGPVLFMSLLPFIITPVIGALSIRWLFVGDGILTAALEALLGRKVLPFAQGWSIELLMMLYRVWHTAPFAFILFYAGLQTLNQDTLAAAVVDGASRWQRLRYVVLPHLAPLVLFVSLIHLMDAYRVFDEVVGFSSQAHVISLQWLTFDLLTPNSNGSRAIGRASASSVLTLVGIVVLLTPLLLRTWREHRTG